MQENISPALVACLDLNTSLPRGDFYLDERAHYLGISNLLLDLGGPELTQKSLLKL